MRVGVTNGNVFADADYREGFQLLKDCGFDCVDLSFTSKLNYNDVTKRGESPFFSQDLETILAYYAPWKEAADSAGIAIGQAHAPFPSYADGNDAANAIFRDAIGKCLAVCRMLGCPYLIVHPVHTKGTLAREREINIAFYSSLIPAAKETGVVICLENMFGSHCGHIEEAVCSDFADAARYIDDLNALAGAELFGFCYDVGHATLLGKEQRRSVNALGKRLKTLHIHDNDGREDLHIQPYACKRGGGYVTDWEGFLKGLHDVGYAGDLSFETDSALDPLPQPLKGVMLAYIAGVGRYFSDQLSAM